MPEGRSSGVERSICEQILADVLETSPPPQTVRALLSTLDGNRSHRGAVALELIATLRRWASETPDTLLDDLVRERH